MSHLLRLSSLLAFFLVVSNNASPHPNEIWQDPSPHKVIFVNVAPSVTLEVLDWGGAGRSVVLLAGSGNTAHVFDEFAPQLAGHWHVYGITRRGFGASTHAQSGYDDQRLADDVVQVLDSLEIAEPVLAGHSMAGGELTTIGREHPHRISGLVYLDALGDPRDWPGSDPAYMELFRKLPKSGGDPAPATPEEKKSFTGSRAAQLRTEGFAFPESELRNSYETNPDGTKGAYKTPHSVFEAIGNGQIARNYAGISVPVLALFAFPHPEKDGAGTPEANIAFDKATAAFVDRWTIRLLRGVSDVHLIDLPGSGHYVYLTRQKEVLAAMDAFLAQSPRMP